MWEQLGLGEEHPGWVWCDHRAERRLGWPHCAQTTRQMRLKLQICCSQQISSFICVLGLFVEMKCGITLISDPFPFQKPALSPSAVIRPHGSLVGLCFALSLLFPSLVQKTDAPFQGIGDVVKSGSRCCASVKCIPRLSRC